MAVPRDITVRLKLDLSEFYKNAKALRRILADEDEPCPHCSRPEGWDACPIHSDHT
jgi:hypothetical protein